MYIIENLNLDTRNEEKEKNKTHILYKNFISNLKSLAFFNQSEVIFIYREISSFYQIHINMNLRKETYI
jgi:hypothetical protein